MIKPNVPREITSREIDLTKSAMASLESIAGFSYEQIDSLTAQIEAYKEQRRPDMSEYRLIGLKLNITCNQGRDEKFLGDFISEKLQSGIDFNVAGIIKGMNKAGTYQSEIFRYNHVGQKDIENILKDAKGLAGKISYDIKRAWIRFESPKPTKDKK